MANLKVVLGRFQVFSKNFQQFSPLVQRHDMSSYASYYIKPVHKKEDLDELAKNGELQKLTHVPVRAALNDQTCSYMQDNSVNLFINYIMKDGNKILARQLVETAFENIKRMQLEKYHKCQDVEEKAKIELNPRAVFYKAVENSQPLLNLMPIKRGGVRYQVPVPITQKHSRFRAMKWLIEAATDKDPNVRFHLQLARELIDASLNTGRVIKRKQDLHRQCEANRAYAHYRWS